MSRAWNPIVASLGCLIFLLTIVGTASARDALPAGTPPADNEPISGIGGAATANVEGDHTMAATVVATDPKTGIMDVTAGGMALKLHFPPSSLANLKTGDKITLRLGFTRP